MMALALFTVLNEVNMTRYRIRAALPSAKPDCLLYVARRSYYKAD